MLLKYIMRLWKMFVNHESGRTALPARPGPPHSRAPRGAWLDTATACRAVSAAPHVHWIGRARRAQRIDPQPQTNRPTAARAAARPASRRGAQSEEADEGELMPKQHCPRRQAVQGVRPVRV